MYNYCKFCTARRNHFQFILTVVKLWKLCRELLTSECDKIGRERTMGIRKAEKTKGLPF